MFRFYLLLDHCTNKDKENFNTSYVSVLLFILYPALTLFVNFNTSYVSVLQHIKSSKSMSKQNFNTSYVSVLLNFLSLSTSKFFISIHRMFRFYWFRKFTHTFGSYISIHRMFRFYPCINSLVQPTLKISIHRMFRFYGCIATWFAFYNVFQYIVCFGSTMGVQENSGGGLNFNTSYVSVLHAYCVKPWLGGFNFNTSYVSVLQREPKSHKLISPFQYIVCFGSTQFVNALST